MSIPPKRFWLATILCLAFGACSEAPQGPPRKETVPVSGLVLVDGQPAADLEVVLHNVQGIDKQFPTFPKAITDQEGKFQITTYDAGDGAPEGEYVATFRWGRTDPATTTYGGPDKLNGRYRDPAASQNRVTVTKGQTVDMGSITLTTQ